MTLRPSYLLAMQLCAALACAGLNAEEVNPVAPEIVRPPKEAKLLYSAKGSGVQIYTGMLRGGKTVWELKAPRADLAVGEAVWKHFAGPTWEAPDGSKIKKIGTADAVAQTPAPKPKADIPWLLIKVQPEGDKTGVLTHIQYVQRILTQGGKAPAEDPKAVGEEIEVPYSAQYNFYELPK